MAEFKARNDGEIKLDPLPGFWEDDNGELPF